MFLRLARLCTLLALFSPVVLAPFFSGATFAFPLNAFFPFISFKAIIFRTFIQSAVFSLLLHLLFSSQRGEEVKKIGRRLKKPLSIAFTLFAGWTLFTAFTAETPQQALWSNFERGEGAFQILHYVLFYFLASTLFTTKFDLHRLLKTHLWASFITSLYALPQFFEIQAKVHTIGGNGRLSGTLGNPSYLAAYLLITFAIIGYFLLNNPTRKAKVILWSLFAFEFFVFLNTGTRGAYMGLAVGIAAFLIALFVMAPTRKTRINLIIAISGLILVAAASLGLYAAFADASDTLLLNRLFDVKGAAKGLEPRLWTWGSALSGIAERPVLGWGAENFPHVFDAYYNPKHFGVESFFDRTHNVFLEYAITGGIPLLLLYLSIFFFHFKSIAGRGKSAWTALLIATPIAHLVQAAFLFDVLPIYIALFLFLALAANTDPAAPTEQLTDEAPYAFGHAELLGGMGIFALCVTLFIITSVLPLKKNILITQALSLPFNQPQNVFNAYQAAILYRSPIGQEEAISNLHKFSLDFLETAARQKIGVPGEIVQGIVATNNAWYDLNLHLMPGLRNTYLNGGLNLRAGMSFGFPEFINRGVAVYEKALEQAPTRVEFITILLDAFRAMGDKESFEKWRTRAAEIRPDLEWQPL